MAFASADDPVLESVMVVEVTPDPDAAHLLVTLELTGDEPIAPEEVRGAVEALRPHLRHEVSQSIHRKRLPNLAYQLVPRGTWDARLAEER